MGLPAEILAKLEMVLPEELDDSLAFGRGHEILEQRISLGSELCGAAGHEIRVVAGSVGEIVGIEKQGECVVDSAGACVVAAVVELLLLFLGMRRVIRASIGFEVEHATQDLREPCRPDVRSHERFDRGDGNVAVRRSIEPPRTLRELALFEEKHRVRLPAVSVACGRSLERVMGIEPTSSAWEAEVLPLNYTRKSGSYGLSAAG